MEHLEQLGPYTYRWDEGCFPLGADSLALGDFATVKPGWSILDLGCGAGLLLFLCARRAPELRLYGVEREEVALRWAQRNLMENGLAAQLLPGDLRRVPLPQGMDLAVSNPPWYPPNAGAQGKAGRTEECSLPELCRAAAGALGPKGRFALVHSPARLAELFSALERSGLEPKRLQFCRARAETPPYAVLVEAVKNGKTGLTVLPDRLSG